MKNDGKEQDTTSSSDGAEPCYFEAARQRSPVDQDRAEDVFDIPLGSVVTSAETGKAWVFFGWSSNSAGTYPNFIEALTPARFPGVPHYDYHAAFADTLERKFPDVSRFRRKRPAD
jgi:hypothetical protein